MSSFTNDDDPIKLLALCFVNRHYLHPSWIIDTTHQLVLTKCSIERLARTGMRSQGLLLGNCSLLHYP